MSNVELRDKLDRIARRADLISYAAEGFELQNMIDRGALSGHAGEIADELRGLSEALKETSGR